MGLPSEVLFKRNEQSSRENIANETFSFLNHVPKVYSIVPDWLKTIVKADTSIVGLNTVG